MRNDPIHISSSPPIEGMNNAQQGPANGEGQGSVHMLVSQDFGMTAEDSAPSAQRYYLTGARTVDTTSGSLVGSRSWHSDAANESHRTEAIRLYQRVPSLLKRTCQDSLHREEAVGLYHRLKSAPLEETRQLQDPTATNQASRPSKPDVTSEDHDRRAQSLAEKLRSAEQRLHLDLRFDTSRDSLNNVNPAAPVDTACLDARPNLHSSYCTVRETWTIYRTASGALVCP